jgi:hypothetical protein
MPTLDSEAIVTSLLAAAQLTVSDEEKATFIRDYPLIRANADALYLDELEPFEPAVMFDPTVYYPA